MIPAELLRPVGLQLQERVTLIPRVKTTELIPGIRHYETADFPLSDPWSQHMRTVLGALRDQETFVGQPVTEFGVGDGRNLVTMGNDLAHVTMVEIEGWRSMLAVKNLTLHEGTAPLIYDRTYEKVTGDVVGVLDNWQNEKREPLSGFVVACLPQSPDGDNAADKYNEDDPLYDHYEQWNTYGLTLNAAMLDKLRPLAQPDLQVLVMLSHRVPTEVRERLIHQTGWMIDSEYQTAEPIQQDPDTGISWVDKIDDGRRFYEKSKDGLFVPISAQEAESRRLDSVLSGRGRDSLNAFHHLSVYRLVPNIRETILFRPNRQEQAA